MSESKTELLLEQQKMVRVKNARKKQGTQPKQAPKKSKARKPRNALPQNITNHPYALARLDPFNPNAAGAKVPDFDNNPSCAASFRMQASFTANASGNMARVITFWPNETYKDCAWDTTNLRWYMPSASGVSLPQTGQMFSGWDECVGLRIVGAGIQFRSPLNGNNVSGRVSFVPMSLSEIRLFNGIAVNGGYSPSEFQVRKGAQTKDLSQLVAGSEVTFVSSALDPTAFIYTDPAQSLFSLTMDSGDSPNILGLVVCIEGAPANVTVLDATIIVHYEWLPGKTYNWMPAQPEPAQLGLMEKVNNIAEQSPRFLDSVGTIASGVFSTLQSGFKVARSIGII